MSAIDEAKQRLTALESRDVGHRETSAGTYALLGLMATVVLLLLTLAPVARRLSATHSHFRRVGGVVVGGFRQKATQGDRYSC